MSNDNNPIDDSGDKTSIVTGDTLSGKLRSIDDTPPALVILIGPQGYVGKQWSLTENEYVIGRAVESGIFLDDRSVSRSHARVNITASEVTVCDLGSANKTVINGTAITSMNPYRLQNNDQIKIGNVIFKFLDRGNLEAITNRQLIEKATKDALTGANSKAALLEKGPEAMKRSEVLNEALSVLVFDIDYFKKINDTYGHSAGDHILREMCGVISQKLVRTNDFFARYGGEEFVILLPGAPQKSSTEIAERIRTTIETTNFVFENKKIPVTISLGLAFRKPEEKEWEQLFKRADDALYKSKQTGRNKVTVVN